MLSGRDGSRLLPISAQARARGRQDVIVRQSACRARMRASSSTVRRRSARRAAITGSATTRGDKPRRLRARLDPGRIALAIARRDGDCLGPGDTPGDPGNAGQTDRPCVIVGLGLR